jgi:nicotinamide-nucleotide amidase
MKAAIITIGDELLIGQTINTNSAWIGAELSKSGFDIYRSTSVHDRREDILSALAEAAGKTDVVLITGGLGPTSDDITKPTLCEFFGTHLVMNHEVLQMIEEMTRRRNFQMNEKNRRQAEVPESCRVLKNASGTAPGMWFEKDGTIYISMPGVPYEMKYLMTEIVLPELNKRFTSQVIVHRNIMTYGESESKLSDRLTDFEAGLPENIKLAYLPASGIIKLRLTGTDSDRARLTESINRQVSLLCSTIPEIVYSEEEETLEYVIGKLLKARKKTVSTAESCTGGAIAHMITSVAGSSEYYTGSVIAYDNSVKRNLLGVKSETIEKYGAVSEETVKEMAEGARKVLKTHFSVATSGIAGPDGGTDTKPVGTVWIAVASEGITITEKRVFTNERSTNIIRFSLAALNLLRKEILKY